MSESSSQGVPGKTGPFSRFRSSDSLLSIPVSSSAGIVKSTAEFRMGSIDSESSKVSMHLKVGLLVFGRNVQAKTIYLNLIVNRDI